MLKGLRAVLSFLTVLPVGWSDDTLETAAKNMELFPLAGVVVGGIAGLSGFAFLTFLPPAVGGLLTLGVLLLVTGLHHTDGLLDFGDGLMRVGSREEKIQAMHDTATGAGGFGLGLVVLLTTAFAVSALRASGAPLALVSAETTAKTAMVLAAGLGRSANPGLGRQFVESMHGRGRAARMALPVAFALAVGFVASGAVGVLSAAGGLAALVVLLPVSQRHFGGLTGDVFGAINDISRMVALLVFIA
jgi:adenosylcobinamide-GDP ribazoletransferase